MSDSKSFGEVTRCFIGGEKGGLAIEINKNPVLVNPRTGKRDDSATVWVDSWTVGIARNRFINDIREVLIVGRFYNYVDALQSAKDLLYSLNVAIERHRRDLPDIATPTFLLEQKES